MNKNLKIVIIGLGIMIILVVSSFLAYRSYDRKEIMKNTLTWSRMEELPESAEIIEIKKEGSAFSREFTITFKASNNDIKKWLDNSSGTSNIEPIRVEGVEKYSIEPGQGAQFAEVLHDTEDNTVTINVYWS